MAEGPISRLSSCTVCLQDYDKTRQPKLLPCYHGFCSMCIPQLKGKCAECRASFTLPPRGVKALKGNIYVEEYRNLTSSNVNTENCCPQHNKPYIELFCKTCEVVVCSACVNTTHKFGEHDYLNMDEVYEMVETDSAKLQEKIREKDENLTAARCENYMVQKELKDTVHGKINNLVESFTNECERVKEELCSIESKKIELYLSETGKSIQCYQQLITCIMNGSAAVDNLGQSIGWIFCTKLFRDFTTSKRRDDIKDRVLLKNQPDVASILLKLLESLNNCQQFTISEKNIHTHEDTDIQETSLCPEHGLPYNDLFCESCKVVLCPKCFQGSHKMKDGHKLQDIEVANDILQTALEPLMSVVRQLTTEMQEIEAIKDHVIKNLVAEVMLDCQLISTQLEHGTKTILSSLLGKLDEHLQKHEEAISKAVSYSSELLLSTQFSRTTSKLEQCFSIGSLFKRRDFRTFRQSGTIFQPFTVLALPTEVHNQICQQLLSNYQFKEKIKKLKLELKKKCKFRTPASHICLLGLQLKMPAAIQVEGEGEVQILQLTNQSCGQEQHNIVCKHSIECNCFCCCFCKRHIVRYLYTVLNNESGYVSTDSDSDSD